MAKLRTIIILLVVGFVGGVLLNSFIDFGWALIGLFFILTLAFGVLFLFHDKSKFFAVIALVCFGFVLGSFRYIIFSSSADNNYFFSQPSTVGIITADPDRRDNTTRLVVELHPSTSLRVTTRVLVVTDNFTDYKYGDQIEITGKIEKPTNFLTDKGKVFDYQNYLKVRGIKNISYYPKIKIIAHRQGSFIKAGLFDLKNSFLNNLKLALPEPAATLAGGLILGDKGGLGTKVENEFRQAGLSHIIVLSGYNISIVAESVLKFFSWFSPAFSWLLGLGSIFLFVMMTGGEAAAVRSAVMGAIALMARRYGRTYDAGVALVFAGFLMILWNPRLLAFDLGFQLSFLATLGMIYIAPLVAKLLRSHTSSEPEVRLRKSFSEGLKELISTTTGAQLAVYPWLLLQSGNATLVGFISNIFILPIVPIAMFASFAVGLIGFLSHFLSLLFSYPTYFLLEYILQGAHLFAGLL
ncbi:MAG: ComEC/Rec2 family competence protein [Candidatus Paceibacterota bacterium]|jgi:competence protein ComEC